MNKIFQNEKGFTVVESLLLAVILMAIGAVGYVVYKHQHKSSSTSSTVSNSSENASTSSQWLPYTSPNGAFSAYFPTSPNFPKTPVVPTNSVTKNMGGVNVTINTVESSNNSNTVYDIGILTFPTNAKIPDLNNTSPYQNVHIIKSKSTTLDGNNAETYELTGTRKAQSITVGGRQETVPPVQIYDTGKFVVVGDVLYEIDAVHNGNTPASYASYFVNSFKLGN